MTFTCSPSSGYSSVGRALSFGLQVHINPVGLQVFHLSNPSPAGLALLLCCSYILVYSRVKWYRGGRQWVRVRGERGNLTGFHHHHQKSTLMSQAHRKDTKTWLKHNIIFTDFTHAGTATSFMPNPIDKPTASPHQPPVGPWLTRTITGKEVKLHFKVECHTFVLFHSITGPTFTSDIWFYKIECVELRI